MDKCQEGPLSTLHRCIGKRVRVVTRHARGVRGTCEGHLAAFDKYMNLVLRVRCPGFALSRRGGAGGAGGIGRQFRVRQCRHGWVCVRETEWDHLVASGWLEARGVSASRE
jgi:hypothetical protein